MSIPSRPPTRLLTVSHRQDLRGNEGLVYSPSRLAVDDDESIHIEATFHPVKWPALEVSLTAIRKCVSDLLVLARHGRPREQLGLEQAGEELSAHILPECGFVNLVEPGAHPHFDIIFDPASTIPWEVLHERYYECRHAGHRQPKLLPRRQAAKHPPFCPEDGQAMQEAGGWLVLDKHISHLVRGGEPVHSRGKVFLLILDPTGDLCDPKVDPQGRCAAHLNELIELLGKQGYQVDLLRGKNATVARVKTAIANPRAVGLYYFGHGCFPDKGDQGYLQLADGPLYAEQVEDINPGIRLVFMNACQGADVGRTWDLEKKYRSVGHAFARGGPAKVVIAPLWPVLNVQAAATALEFFHQAFTAPSLAEALRQARLLSHQRYQAGAADISWIAYRYFGNPHRTMPPPQDDPPPVVAVPAVPPAPASRLFDDDGKLQATIFGFALEAVVVRALKRRNLHGRGLLRVSDLLAGLARKGDLTRLALREAAKQDPDRIYDALIKKLEPAEAGEAKAAVATWKELLARFVQHGLLPGRDQFHPDLLAMLERADQQAQQRGGSEEKISERDVLTLATSGDSWPGGLESLLPPIAALREWLTQNRAGDLVDANGRLRLDRLDAAARRVLDMALSLAQQRGLKEIGNRVVAGTFLVDPRGGLAKCVKEHGISAQVLGALLIASNKRQEAPAGGLTLNTEVSGRVVLPMLRKALELAGKDAAIGERLLFQAFCLIAEPQMKVEMRQFEWPLRLDLDVFVSQDTPPKLVSLRDKVDDGFWQTLLLAGRIAQLQAGQDIRNPHLAAALLSEGFAGFRALLEKHDKNVDEARKELLRVVRMPKPEAAAASIAVRAKVRLGNNAQTIMARTLARAEKEKRPAGNQDVLEALLSEEDNIVVVVLKKMGMEWPMEC